MKLESYSIDKEGVKGICKSPAIWGNNMNTNEVYPLVYLGKPKWMTDEAFNKVLDGLRLDLPQFTYLEREK